MKFKYLTINLLIPLLLLNVVKCKSQFTKWESNKTISNIEFEKVRYKLEKQDTALIIGYLKNATTINNYNCAAGIVNLTKNFKLLLFKLSEPLKLNNYVIEKDTWVSLEKSGYYVCTLLKEANIQGFNCMPGKTEDGPRVTFDNEGNLRSFFSPTDIKIGEIFCSGGKSNEIGMLKNGKLGFCRLSIDQNINDVNYNRGSILYFDYNGNVSLVKEKK